jgi:DNA-binding CsgD family transcriptional regulator
VVEVGAFVVETNSRPISAGSYDSAPCLRKESGPHNDAVLLSMREGEVLRLLASGNSNKEISCILSISVKTVETYRARLMLKINAPSLTHLVHYAIRHQIVQFLA